ncbi:MAG: hydrogenase maturation nickel metallochaperone HypA [Candidatus Margulisiibacteriota bacterium]
MHELNLAKDILKKILTRAQAEGKEKVAFARILLGQSRFTHLEELKELLQEIVKNTAAEGAKVEIEIVPLKAACAACGKEFSPGKFSLACSQCGSTNIKLAAGDELAVEQLK